MQYSKCGKRKKYNTFRRRNRPARRQWNTFSWALLFRSGKSSSCWLSKGLKFYGYTTIGLPSLKSQRITLLVCVFVTSLCLVKEEEMRRSSHVAIRKRIEKRIQNISHETWGEERDFLGHRSINGKIILKWILQKSSVNCGLGLSGSGLVHRQVNTVINLRVPWKQRIAWQLAYQETPSTTK
jgi:hypothetical protein